MKKISILLVIIMSSCHSKHFEFDNVEHYHIDISDEKVYERAFKSDKSYEETLFESILVENYPAVIDKNFIMKLEEIYPIKQKIDNSKLFELKEIYCNKINFGKSKCIPIYRDVLVFKQKDSIVGVSKICFGCEMQYTINKSGEQKEFDNNDFKKLKKILK